MSLINTAGAGLSSHARISRPRSDWCRRTALTSTGSLRWRAASYFDDELSHRTEHSIEFQVVFLQYLLGAKRDFSIVPILVGSFHDLMERGIDPIEDPQVSRFVEALRAAEVVDGKRVAYIGGIDLCHVGPEFGDTQPG